MAGGVVGIAGNIQQAAQTNNPSPNTTTGSAGSSSSTNTDANNFMGTGMSAAQVAALTSTKAASLGISSAIVGQAVRATVTEQQYSSLAGGNASSPAITSAPPALDAAKVAASTSITYLNNGNNFSATTTLDNGKQVTTTGTVPANPLTLQGGTQRDYQVQGIVFDAIQGALPSVNDAIANQAVATGASKGSFSSNIIIDADKGTYKAYNAAGGQGANAASFAAYGGSGQASFITSGNLGQQGSSTSGSLSITSSSVPSTSSIASTAGSAGSYSFLGGQSSQVLFGGAQLPKTVSVLASQGYSNSQISDIVSNLRANPNGNLVETINKDTGELTVSLNPTGTANLSQFTSGIKPSVASGTYTISNLGSLAKTTTSFAPTKNSSVLAYDIITNLGNKANAGIENTGVNLGITSNFVATSLFGGKFAGANAGNLQNPNAYILFASKEQVQPTPSNPIASNIGQFAIESTKNVVGLGFGIASLAVAPQIAIPNLPSSSFAFGGQIAQSIKAGKYGTAAADIGFLIAGKPASPLKLGKVVDTTILGEQKLSEPAPEAVPIAITQSTTGLSDITALQNKGADLGLEIKQVVGTTAESKVYPNLNFSVGYNTKNFTGQYDVLAQNIKSTITERQAQVVTNLGESPTGTFLSGALRQPTEATTLTTGATINADLNVLSVTNFNTGSFIRQFGAGQIPFKASNELAVSGGAEIPTTSTLFVAKEGGILANKVTTGLNIITKGRIPISPKVTTYKEIQLKAGTAKITPVVTYALKKPAGEPSSIFGRTGVETNISNPSASAFILNEAGSTERGKLFTGQELNTGNFAMHLTTEEGKTKGGEVINVSNPTEAYLAAYTAFKRGNTNVLLQGKGTLLADTAQLLSRELPNVKIKGIVEVKPAPPSKSLFVRTGVKIGEVIKSKTGLNRISIQTSKISKPQTAGTEVLLSAEQVSNLNDIRAEYLKNPKGYTIEKLVQNEGYAMGLKYIPTIKRLGRTASKGATGAFNPRTHTLEYSANMPASLLEVTVRHELAHATFQEQNGTLGNIREYPSKIEAVVQPLLHKIGAVTGTSRFISENFITHEAPIYKIEALSQFDIGQDIIKTKKNDVILKSQIPSKTIITRKISLVNPSTKQIPNAKIQLQDLNANATFTNFARQHPATPAGIELEAARQNEGALKVLKSKQEETQGNYISSKTPFGKEVEFRSPINRRADTSLPQIANARIEEINQHLTKAQEQAQAKEHNRIFENSNEIHNLFSGTATKVESPKSKGVYSTEALMGTNISFSEFELPKRLPPKEAGKAFGTTGIVTGIKTTGIKTTFAPFNINKERVGQAKTTIQSNGILQSNTYKNTLFNKQANQFREAGLFKEGLASNLLTKSAQAKEQVKTLDLSSLTKQLTSPIRTATKSTLFPAPRARPKETFIPSNNSPLMLSAKKVKPFKNNQRFKTAYVPSVIGLEFAKKISKKKAAEFSRLGGLANSFTRPAIK